MMVETKFKVWGYWKKSRSDSHPFRKCIGTADTIEKARQLKEAAEDLGWPTVCIFAGDRIVEPARWAGRQQPL
jgi:hypothetical protein